MQGRREAACSVCLLCPGKEGGSAQELCSLPLRLSGSAGSTRHAQGGDSGGGERSTRRTAGRGGSYSMKGGGPGKEAAARVCGPGKRGTLQIAEGYREKDRCENGKVW